MKSHSYTVPKRWSWQEAHTGCPHYIALTVLCIFSQDFSICFLVHTTSDTHVFCTTVVSSSGTFSSVHSLSCAHPFVTPWTAAHQVPCPLQLPELAQIHVRRVGDALQPSRPLLSPSPSAFNLSQHQGLFQ